ncbi:right-handed parallel beta-helix repeat-containing protein [Kineococcus sp. SYSU DK005]|uniref:right-handed parallel beta-helix repeat-containing protein n=1 Tax=Kineococcus sp. SYSU DK005 TaxID=3383126 RepID=UPI003D7C6CF2
MRTAGTTVGTARGRVLRRLAAAGAAGTLLAVTLPAGVAAAGSGTTWRVHPGQSIQAAVDRARSGDTIQLAAGTYRESVCVVGKGLTVKGAGRERTTLTWSPWDTVADLPAVASNPCLEAQNVADAEDDNGTLVDNVSGLFFLNPDRPVKVRDLATRDHPANGVVAWGARGFEVKATRGTGHERYGILAADSTDVSIKDNVEVGVVRSAPVLGGTAGISVGDSAHADATIAGNTVRNYNLGVFAREARTGVIKGNTLTGNCAGVLVFDDSATEIPDTSRHVVGGDWSVKGNHVADNTRYCLVGRDGSQRVSGTGIAVTNADRVNVSGNTLRGNRPVVPAGQDPVNFPSGGVSLISFSSPPGTNPPGAVPPGLVEHVTVKGNTFRDNAPTDVFVSQPNPYAPLIQGPGEGIVIKGNRCGSATGLPVERCS